jgi:hypothetical protein
VYAGVTALGRVIELSGLSALACSADLGALSYTVAHVRVRRSNFTNMKGGAGTGGAVLHENEHSFTAADFVNFADNGGGVGCFCANSSQEERIFSQCNFVNDSAGAIAHLKLAQTTVSFCYFADTNLSGSEFVGGSVKVESCLFAGEVPTMPEHFSTEGVQISFASRELTFDTGSLLPPCGVLGSLVPSFEGA